MICQNCGTLNEEKGSRCKMCNLVLKKTPPTAEYSSPIIQSPLREIKPSNLIKIEQTDQNHSQSEYYSEATPLSEDSGAPFSHSEPSEDLATEQTFFKKSPALTAGITVFSLISITVMFLMVSHDPHDTANHLFSQAEEQYDTQNFSQALISYRQFIEQYPENPLIPLAQDKLKELTAKLIAEAHSEVNQLMEKAEKAYQEKHYLIPASHNVILYTQQVLTQEPIHARALELQAKVINYYDKNAQSAIKKHNYKTAIMYYKNILKIMPDDPDTIQKLKLAQSSVSR